MSSFVRFIFVVIVAGIVLNLVIVGVANVNSERTRESRTQQERENFARLLTSVNGRLCTTDIAVEDQLVHARGTVEKSTILIRQYYLTENEKNEAMPVQRLTIDGDRLCVDGLFLDFDALFAPEDPNLQVLRGIKLAYIDHIYAEGQKEEDRFTLLPEFQVPELTRINPVLSPDIDDEGEQSPAAKRAAEQAVARNAMSFPSYYELRIWQQLWEYIKHPATAPRGLTVTHLPAATQQLKSGHVYSAMGGADGVSLRDVTAPRLLNRMLQKASDMDAEAALKRGVRPASGSGAGADKPAK